MRARGYKTTNKIRAHESTCCVNAENTRVRGGQRLAASSVRIDVASAAWRHSHIVKLRISE